MPTYDYVCEACQHRFEHWQAIRARKLRTCPACGKPTLVRLIGSGAGVIFRGSGFYETDYKRKPAASPTSSPASTPAPAAESSSPPAPSPSPGPSSPRSPLSPPSSPSPPSSAPATRSRSRSPSSRR